MSVLSVRNITKCYKTKTGIQSSALNGVNFEVSHGEFVGIMGPSGAGKSTLLNVIATIDSVTSGSMQIGEQDLSTMREPKLSEFRRNKLGFIFRDYNLLDTLTLQENIALPLILAKVKTVEIEQRVRKVAVQLGIEELLLKYPCEVSGGQRQRASAARAIVHQPELILADEPTGALDSKSATDLLQCMQGLNEQISATILMVTHDAFAASFCKRVLFIKDGEIYREIKKNGTRKQFYDDLVRVVAELGGDQNELH